MEGRVRLHRARLCAHVPTDRTAGRVPRESPGMTAPPLRHRLSAFRSRVLLVEPVSRWWAGQSWRVQVGVVLALVAIVRLVAQNSGSLGESRGITGIPHPGRLFGADFGLLPLPYYYLTLVAIALSVVVITRLNRSRVGRAWSAIREDEDAAEA